MIAKTLKIIIGGIALLMVVLLLIGILAPHEYRGTISTTLPKSPSAVYAWLQDIDDIPNRRPEIKLVENLPNNEQGLPVWKEFHGDTFSIFQVIEMRANENLSIQTVTSNFGLSGTWSYALKGIDGGNSTQITITEVSDAYDFINRILFTVMGRKYTLKTEVKALEHWANGN